MKPVDDRTERVPASAAGDPSAASASVTVAPARDAAELATIAALARDIWLEFYERIIGRAQVEYMLDRFQTEDAIAGQLRDGCEYFLARRAGRAIGYLAVKPDADQCALFLSKLYLRHDARGGGVGTVLLRFVEDLARARELESIWLTVNKRSPTVAVYERMGFRIVADVCTDIGGGFVMDDHRMEKRLARDVRTSPT